MSTEDRGKSSDSTHSVEFCSRRGRGTPANLGLRLSTQSSVLSTQSSLLAADLLSEKASARHRYDAPDGGLPLIVEKKHLENFTILYVEGLIKLGESAEFFSSALENVLKNESTNVIIDFTKIDYIDSTGIGELVGYLGKFTTQNRKLILVNPSERVQKLLRLAKLDAVFKIYGTEDEAVASENTPAKA
jgi:anti-anti-sigma factor